MNSSGRQVPNMLLEKSGEIIPERKKRQRNYSIGAQQCWKRSVFISVPKEGNAKQCSNYSTIATHFTCQQSHAQNRSSQISTVHKPRNSRYTSWIQKRQRNQRSNCQHLMDHTPHTVLKARKLKWFAIPFSSGPHSVRTLHHDPPILGGPTGHGSQFH